MSNVQKTLISSKQVKVRDVSGNFGETGKVYDAISETYEYTRTINESHGSSYTKKATDTIIRIDGMGWGSECWRILDAEQQP